MQLCVPPPNGGDQLLWVISIGALWSETSTTTRQASRRIGQKHAFYKVLIEDGTGRILGAHLLGHNAAEAINIFALAMKFGLTTRDLKKVLWAYPTHISDVKYMLD